MSRVTEFGQVKNRQDNRQSAGARLSFYVNPAHSISNLACSKFNPAFTIVELLIVIVIIGILAAITIVSYSGITQKANIAALQSDLTNASKKLNIYYTLYNAYPATMTSTDGGRTYCPTDPAADTDYCIKLSSANTFNYSINPTDGFIILASKGSSTYSVTKDASPAAWVTIGAQTWAAKNLNVGKIVTGVAEQTNNSIIEKYCHDNNEANCATYGALYQWNEAMQYVTIEGAQGVCPAGSHIPSDNEWKILEMQLGMTQAEADKQDVWRGTDQGAQIRVGGTSGLSIPLAGYRTGAGLLSKLLSEGYIWSSSESTSNAWRRNLYMETQSKVGRDIYDKSYGFSIRCLAN